MKFFCVTLVCLLFAFTDAKAAATTVTNNASGSQVNLPIPSFGSGGTGTTNDFTTSSIEVTNAPADSISDVNVSITLNHSFVGDLIIRVIAPDGLTTDTLVSSSNNDGNGYSGTIFDDQAARPISEGADPFFGSYRPVQPLSIFNGKAANGIWTLQIEDITGGDSGTFSGWSLEITTGGVIVPPAEAALTIQTTNNNQVVISWPSSASGYTLQTKATLSDTNWTTVATAPTVVANRFEVTLPASGPSGFFRLKQ